MTGAFDRTKMRLVLTVRGMFNRMTLGVRVLALQDACILLVRHSYVKGLHMPGGGVDPGETAPEAAAREMAEESGYAPGDAMRLFGLYHSTVFTDRDHVALYVCQTVTPIAGFRRGREISEVGWFPLADLPADVTPATRRRLAEVLEDRTPDTRW